MLEGFSPKPMPKGWKSPLREPLYRVVVDARGERFPLAVGPAMLWDACNQFQHEIQLQIAKGKERDWSNPTIIPA